jgi:hypothetical protein
MHVFGFTFHGGLKPARVQINRTVLFVSHSRTDRSCTLPLPSHLLSLLSAPALCFLGGEAGLGLREKSGKLCVEVDGSVLAELSDHVRFLKRRLGEDVMVEMSLGDVLTKRSEALRKRVEGKQLVVVRGTDIEVISAEVRALQGRRLMGDLLTDIRRDIL